MGRRLQQVGLRYAALRGCLSVCLSDVTKRETNQVNVKISPDRLHIIFYNCYQYSHEYCYRYTGVLLLLYWCTATGILVYCYCYTGVLLLLYWCIATGILVYCYCYTGVLLLVYWCTATGILVYCYC